MIRYIILALVVATPAAAIQCPDGTWRDLVEHCSMPPRYQCLDGSWRDSDKDCDDQRPPQRPNGE